MTAGEELLAGPYGRELCAAIAQEAAPGDVWIRGTDADFVAALHYVRPEQVAALDGRQVLAVLETVVGSAVYWQEPRDDRDRLTRPEVVAALRPIADAVAAHPATAWWGEPLDRSAQTHLRYWSREWEPLLDPVDARPALRRWRDRVIETEHRLAGDPHWRSTSGAWWSDPAFAGAAWTTPGLPGFGPVRLYCTEDSLGWDHARVHPVVVDDQWHALEIDGPDAWARLVDEYPLEVTHGKRGSWWRTTGRDTRWWIPDWPAVAEDYDAVHVTVTGYLATAGWAIPTARGATVLAGWGPGHTCWLRPDRLTYTGVVQQWHRTRQAEIHGTSTWRRVPSEGPDGAVDIRELDDDDAALLADATLFNVNWTGEQRLTADHVSTDPALSHYTVVQPDRGDFGLVAEVGGRAIGVVWLLFLDSSDPGFGYVADGVPELSVCVWPGYRGVGLGGLLLDAAIVAARERGVARICLSVEDGNPAKRLYRDRGFGDASGMPQGTMVRSVR